MKCVPGFCLVCDKEIAKACESCSSRKPTQDYTTIELVWSNGARMTTAVCVECSKGPVWQADKMALTQAIWDAWDKTNSSYSKEVVIV